jgi:hypothetical protein
MDSTQLRSFRRGFSDWHPFDKRSIKSAPQQIGVYIIRKAEGQCFGRLRGESDILYIGSTKSEGGLKKRLQHYFHPGPTQWTNRRINELANKYRMEVAWCPCSEPRNLEHELLKRYLKEHDELPPFNHAGIRRLYKSVTDAIRLSDSVTVIKRKSETDKTKR